MKYSLDSNFIDNLEKHTIGWILNEAYIKYVY